MTSLWSKFKAHRQVKKYRKEEWNRIRNNEVRASVDQRISAFSSALLPITVYFPGNSNSVYVRKVLYVDNDQTGLQGISDTLVSRENSCIQVCNFSPKPYYIHQEQLVGYAPDPSKYLDKPSQGGSLTLQKSFAGLIQGIATALRPVSNIGSVSQVEPLIEEVQGSPKTQELPPEFVSSTRLSTEVNINPDLTKEQQI
ncbi:hypothetical protein M422DRAFT_53423 [Sphaerobolus stellatus SS14]|uniref:Uncharacterized protein n=1 Tax=Sphaerobolus stellatus (strain SS14) TaxID=990650 RepID=A0A0C9V175_SPHS4|nr:hypothetical protein M422DRAFT_53423 [Sphaerobolus stellatus SS14]